MEKIFKALLVMLGFGTTSCTEVFNFGAVEEYGVPTVDFTIKGRVVDAGKKPVKDIEISVSHNDYELSSAKSDASGRFELKDSAVGFGRENFTLKFEDIDGEANGGYFTEKHLSLTFSDEDLDDKGKWTKRYSKEVGDVVLDKEN